MDLRAQLHERITGQDHVMFPAVETADSTVGPLIDHQAAAISFAPHSAFPVSGFELAVAAQDHAIVADEEQRAINCATRTGIPLRYGTHSGEDVTIHAGGPGSALFDGIGNAEWLDWFATFECSSAIDESSWGQVKNLYR